MVKVLAQESFSIGSHTIEALLYENQEGRFLRLSVQQNLSCNTIVIPHMGLFSFSDVLARMIQFEDNANKK